RTIRFFNDGCLWFITNKQDDITSKVILAHDRIEITACPRSEYGRSLFIHLLKCTPSSDVTVPMTDAASPCSFKMVKARSASAAATAMGMPSPILQTQYIAISAMFPDVSRQEEISGTSQLVCSRSTHKPAGSIRGKFS